MQSSFCFSFKSVSSSSYSQYLNFQAARQEERENSLDQQGSNSKNSSCQLINGRGKPRRPMMWTQLRGAEGTHRLCQNQRSSTKSSSVKWKIEYQYDCYNNTVNFCENFSVSYFSKNQIIEIFTFIKYLLYLSWLNSELTIMSPGVKQYNDSQQ
ncbi:Hypothetical_protein [Hexamita inflata]|uniref:Hypothetical_protein n=1 Tax=Hexamita inflata TaxID=28002 RepID=A0AA86QZU1_9EUKA|nr:Hypothetical protein HINF_LOCUS50678 [Hexamita inflata]